MIPEASSFFDPKKALHDLSTELKRYRHPPYPSRLWRLALSIAESHDTMRKVRAINDATCQPSAPILVDYIEDINPHKLIFRGFYVQPAPSDPLPEKTLDGKILDNNWRRDLRRARANYRIKRREAPLARERDALLAELTRWCKREIGRKKALAEALGILPSLLSNWLAKRQPLPLKYCPAIKRFLQQNSITQNTMAQTAATQA